MDNIRQSKREWARRNPDVLKKHSKTWHQKHPKWTAYAVHKSHANARGIEFTFTRDEWVTWWGEDYDKRGPNIDDLCMCRNGDTGAYSPDNVYKATRRQNWEDARG